MRQQYNLFANATPKQTEAEAWRWELPNLEGHDVAVAFDTETSGLDVWRGDRPVGMSVAVPEGQAWYIPWAHESGHNFDLSNVVLWASENLRGKTLVGANTKFDVHMLRSVDIDLEALGCRLQDIQYHAALIDERRRDYDLDSLARDYLNKRKIVLELGGMRISEASSESIRAYAEYDARLTMELHRHFQPIIEREDLEQVRALEDDLIYAVCEMERNGAPLDMEKLVAWEQQCVSRYQRLVLDIYRECGFKVEPSKPKDLAKLFSHYKLDWEETPTGQPSFTRESLRKVQHLPAVQMANEARQLHSLHSKYLRKYLREVGPDGILRYNLNQLKSSYEGGSSTFGTVTGRFSSSDVNIQQVYSEERQIDRVGDAFIIRELFVETAPGHKWFSADASQIEFRIFAHYCRDERIIAAYNDDPTTDYHKVVAELCGIPRKPAKNINFGRVYGMGRAKMAREMKMKQEESDPLFDLWDKNFPAGVKLLKEAEHVAKTRGHVLTYLKRRARFDVHKKDERFYSAWNRVGQGTAADIMKLVILDTYKNRKKFDLVMRLTVHDELCGGIPPELKSEFEAFLNIQRLPLRVPITWNLKVGDSWRL